MGSVHSPVGSARFLVINQNEEIGVSLTHRPRHPISGPCFALPGILFHLEFGRPVSPVVVDTLENTVGDDNKHEKDEDSHWAA